MRRFTAAVLGLGQVGQGYDYAQTDPSVVKTHAAAFAHHPGYDLIGGVDPDPVQRERFEHKFGRPSFASYAGLLSRARPDVVAIAVPTALHCQALSEVLEGQPRAVVCEKPIAPSVAEGEAMVAAAKRHECALLVNYIRRFEPGLLCLRQELQQGDLGTVYKGVVWYTKGLLHNGSHFVDLLRFLMGEAEESHIIDPGRKLDTGDAEPDVMIRFGAADIAFIAAREERFSLAEMTLVATGGKVAYANGGHQIQIEKVGDTGSLGNPRSLPTEMSRYQWHVVDHLHRHLTTGSPLNSTGATALESLRVVERILSSSNGRGA